MHKRLHSLMHIDASEPGVRWLSLKEAYVAQKLQLRKDIAWERSVRRTLVVRANLNPGTPVGAWFFSLLPGVLE